MIVIYLKWSIVPYHIADDKTIMVKTHTKTICVNIFAEWLAVSPPSTENNVGHCKPKKGCRNRLQREPVYAIVDQACERPQFSTAHCADVLSHVTSRFFFFTVFLILTSEASLVAQWLKHQPAMRESWVRSLGWEDPLDEGNGNPLPVFLPGKSHGEEPGGLYSMG